VLDRKIGATRCHTLRLKCIKSDFCWGSAPDPTATGGAYSAPLGPVAVYLWGPTRLLLRGGRRKEQGKGRGRERKKRDGRMTLRTPVTNSWLCHGFMVLNMCYCGTVLHLYEEKLRATNSFVTMAYVHAPNLTLCKNI